MGTLEVSDPPPTREGPQECLLDNLLGNTPIAEEERRETAQAVVVLEEEIRDLLLTIRRGGAHRDIRPEMGSSVHFSMCQRRQPNSHTLHDARGSRNVVREISKVIGVTLTASSHASSSLHLVYPRPLSSSMRHRPALSRVAAL
jgi:hypothetical protein